jgi:hypothetical protein
MVKFSVLYYEEVEDKMYRATGLVRDVKEGIDEIERYFGKGVDEVTFTFEEDYDRDIYILKDEELKGND